MDELHIGIDVGGTFTDVVAAYGRRLATAKLSSTPADPAIAVLRGLHDVLRQLGAAPDAITSLSHGTTVATNAALERKGARVGFITTAGFEDVIEIGRLQRTDIYDLATQSETPVFIAPRPMRLGVTERIGPDGAVVTALDEPAVHAAVDRLVREGATSIAVGYLFAYLNPVHEQRTRAIIAAYDPALLVSLSSDVDPRFREYERFTTTLFDAYLKPLVANYLGRLEQHLAGAARFNVIRSSGGLCSAAAAAARPVMLLQSGLAAGVLGACATAVAAGYPDAITVDIGGTSCDVALTKAGRAGLRSETRLQTFPIRTPTIDVSTIGAGGGSIAWLDAAGGLHVGPESAGAAPGPACYGKGGTAATVTDASLVLGYVSADRFADGRVALDRQAARASIAPIAEALGLTIEDAAAGIHRILNAAMTDEIHRISLHRGDDPRDYALVLLGGGGPIHGAALARDLGIRRMVIPLVPGLLAAYGLLMARVTHEQMRPFGRVLDDAALPALAAACAMLDRQGRVALDTATASFTAQMRYAGQSHELEVALPEPTAPGFIPTLRQRFEQLHSQFYGRISPGRAIEITSLAATHAAAPPPAPVFEPPSVGDLARALTGSRPVYDDRQRRFVDTPVYERLALPAGTRLHGPAIVEQLDTTTILPAGASAAMTPSGALVVSLPQAA